MSRRHAARLLLLVALAVPAAAAPAPAVWGGTAPAAPAASGGKGAAEPPAAPAALEVAGVAGTPAASAASGGGPLVIVGGALSRDHAAVYRAILGRRLPGRPLCVLPTASAEPRRSMRSYLEDFRRYGGAAAAAGVLLAHRRPQRAQAPRTARRLAACGGFFFTGGDQSRIADVLLPGGCESSALAAVRRVWQRGGVVAGSSAGAAMMSDPMIAGGSSAEALAHGVVDVDGEPGVWLRRGLGFFPSGLVDQHALARGRLGRLAVALARHRAPYGFAIDEDTALVVEGSRASVVGRSGVMVLERSGVAGRRLRGRLWLLGDGDSFDLAAAAAEPAAGKQPLPPLPPPVPPAEPWRTMPFTATWLPLPVPRPPPPPSSAPWRWNETPPAASSPAGRRRRRRSSRRGSSPGRCACSSRLEAVLGEPAVARLSARWRGRSVAAAPHHREAPAPLRPWPGRLRGGGRTGGVPSARAISRPREPDPWTKRHRARGVARAVAGSGGRPAPGA